MSGPDHICQYYQEFQSKNFCEDNANIGVGSTRTCFETANRQVKCERNGYFSARQINASHEWCVNSVGMTIPETVRELNSGELDFEPYCSVYKSKSR